MQNSYNVFFRLKHRGNNGSRQNDTVYSFLTIILFGELHDTVICKTAFHKFSPRFFMRGVITLTVP